MRSQMTPAQQAITGLVVAIAIIVTLMCGLAVTLSDRERAVAEALPTATVFRVPTLTLGGPTRTPTREPTAEPAVIVISTTAPATSKVTSSPLSPMPSFSPTPTLSACRVVPGWTAYRIQPGDTLFLIGLRYGLTVDGVMRGNCLTDTRILAGNTLYVPPVTPIPLETWEPFLTTTMNPSQPTLEPSATGTLTPTDGACTDPNSVITKPKVWQIITGSFPVTGTARVSGFSFYKIEIRQEGTPTAYANLYTGEQEVANGTLATLDTTIWPNGEYWIRLVVVDHMSNYLEPCALLVVFQNY